VSIRESMHATTAILRIGATCRSWSEKFAANSEFDSTSSSVVGMKSLTDITVVPDAVTYSTL
jgi:hypothetical protein